MKKKLLSILLVLSIVITLLPPKMANAGYEMYKVMSYPTKTTYQIGETFDTSGLSVMYVLPDGSMLDYTRFISHFVPKDKMTLKHGDKLTKAGTVEIDLKFSGDTAGKYTITIIDPNNPTPTDSQSNSGTVINPEDWPFVPSQEHMTDGMVKSGWKYIITNGQSVLSSKDDKDDKSVQASKRFNYAFYFEHLGNNIYYIRGAYGDYLSYAGKASKGASVFLSDTPCKWMLQSEYVKPAVYYFISPDEDHKLSLSASYSAYLDRYAQLDKNQKFDIMTAVGEDSIPQWWFDLQDGKPAPKGDPRGLDDKKELEYMYYDKQSFAEETKLPVKGTAYNYNIELKSYDSNEYPKLGSVIKSVLLSRNERGTYLKAYADGEYVTITKHSASGEQLGAMPIEYELPLFGAIYSGKEYNYIAFGKTDKEEDNSKESIRIVKYDKEWKRISSVALKGGQTKATIPFNATSARFTENGNQLILHTGRTRFKSSDGVNHQSNLSIYVDTKEMKVTYISPLFPDNHVSHSFDAYVKFDGNNPVFLDLGDGSPRSVVLHKASGSTFTKATMFGIKGLKGANYTGVTVGGFEVSKKNYLTVVASIDQSAAKWGKGNSDPVKNAGLSPSNSSSLGRDIIVCVLPRNFDNGAKAKQITIGEYRKTKITPLSPQLLKINDNKFAVLWGEYSGKIVSDTWTEQDWLEEPDDYDKILIDRYLVQYIDGDGKKIGSPKEYKSVDDFYNEYAISAANGK